MHIAEKNKRWLPVVVGLVIAAGILLCPPWVSFFKSEARPYHQSRAHGFVFMPPKPKTSGYEVRLDTDRLFTELGVVALLSGAVFLALTLWASEE